MGGLNVSASLKEVDDIIDRCFKEITESPDSITAYLATELLAVIYFIFILIDYQLPIRKTASPYIQHFLAKKDHISSLKYLG